MALARWSRATLAGLRHSTCFFIASETNHAFLFAFDLIELSGEDLRREPLEQRKIERYWLKTKNPASEAALREAEGEWGR
jgi:hypothetical protein